MTLSAIPEGQSYPLVELPNQNHPILRLNSICPYYTMFPLNFPFDKLASANQGDWILDPFCGRGTTNYAARLRGLPSYGIDCSPIASAIASAKFVNLSPELIYHTCSEIIKNSPEPEDIPQGRFWELCYHSSTLKQVCKVREELLRDCSSSERTALRTLLLGILHGPTRKGLPAYLSNQMPRTYSTKPNAAVRYWEKNGMKPKKINLLEVVKRRTFFSFSHLPPSCDGGIIFGDSRDPMGWAPKEGFSWIITSPPYFGMNTYTQDQWLRYWFLGGPNVVDYSQSHQIAHSGKSDFINGLSKVWSQITDVCAPESKLVVRFGSLPSLPCDPEEILTRSLEIADCGWQITHIEDAGFPSKGKRQSEQFLKKIEHPAREIDLHASLT